MSAYRSGFVALIGRPNVGKSTILNAIVGEKVAIVSDKPQTTRNRILGVRHWRGEQAVFIDTPGLHKPRDLLGERMVRAAESALSGVDAACLIVDLAGGPGASDRRAAEVVLRVGCPVALLGNKRDLVPGGASAPELFEAALKRYRDAIPGTDVSFAVSGLTGEGLPALLQWIRALLPEGPPYFPEDQVTDQPERRIVAELVREQMLARIGEEVPYGVAVVVGRMEARDGGLVYVEAFLYVDRETHKGIIIGRGGAMLKAIGQAARQEIEGVLGSRVYLDLHVKAKKGWRDRAGALAELEIDG